MSRQKKKPGAICEWAYQEWEDSYDTGCGETFQVIEGTLAENKVRFCCYCGNALKERRPR